MYLFVDFNQKKQKKFDRMKVKLHVSRITDKAHSLDLICNKRFT